MTKQLLWRFVALVMAFAMVTALSACGDDDDEATDTTAAGEDTTTTEDEDEDTTTTTEAEAEPASVQEVTIETSSTSEGDAKTYAFSAPEGLTAGSARFNLDNNGDEPHHVQVVRLNDGSTMEDVQAALQSENPEAALFQVVTPVGGTGVVDPGGESNVDAIIDLTEGEHLLLCFIAGTNGVPHLAQGMLQPFTVGAAEGEATEPPAADATVTGVDFAFEVDSFPADGVVEFVNSSEGQLHEMNVFRLAEGATQEDAVAFFDGEAPPGPPPFSGQGGIQAIAPGASQVGTADLEAGEYVLFCAIPDPSDGVPHYKKGMVTTVTVG